MLDAKEVKMLVDKMCETVDNVITMAKIELDTDKAVRLEMGLFMMYLSASDGTIKWEEARVISEICKLNLTPDNIGVFIRENNIYSTEFETKVPALLTILVKADNELIANNIKLDTSISELYVTTFKSVGQVLIEADDNVDDNEMSDYRIYVGMLEKYVDEHLNKISGNTTGFVKNSGAVSAPSKGGVIAPKKG